MDKNYFIWIDWMKVLAMYLIIAGHYFVPGYPYIYVFSVPSFFILCGYLFKKEPWNVFIKKSFWNLIVPMMLLLIINAVYKSLVNSWGFLSFIKVIIRSMAGYQGENYAFGGLGALWFVYTLIVCRLIIQVILNTVHKRIILLITIFLFLIACVIYNRIEVSPYLQFNSIVNALLALPFFSIGFLLSFYKERICSLHMGIKTVLLFMVSVILVYLCGNHNGLVYLYKCSFGRYLSLCFLGGMAGVYGLFFLSRLCEICFGHRKAIEILGQGTIIILGLHVILLSLLTELRFSLFPGENGSGFDRYLLSLLILLVFIPINIFCKRYLPILFGKLRVAR